MAWNQEPAETDVQTLLELSGHCFTRNEAVARLKSNGLDVSRAMNEFFDDTTSGYKYKNEWDENVWTADREGPQNAAGIQFNVQGPDVTSSHFDISSGAPTRPPSRANNRSPMGAPTTQADEDADLQRALAESAAESGLPPQESGIIGSDVNEKKFGPATRTEYEQDQWAMVPTKLAALTQQRLEIPPSNRKRTDAAPAFLQTSQDHRLGGLVTILANIPLARNALLSCGDLARTYGYDNQWWQGKHELPQGHPNFHDELHRLVAFLDGTDRAYGSVDSLASTIAHESDPDSPWAVFDAEEGFLNVLKEEFEISGNPAIKPLVSHAATVRLGHSDDDKGFEIVNLSLLTIPLVESQSQMVNNIYNALDTVFWNEATTTPNFPNSGSATSFFTEPGDIFAIRIGGDGLCKPCDIPPTLYLDRYMESRRQDALIIQRHINVHQFGLMKLKSLEETTQTYDVTGPNDQKQVNWLQDQSSRRQALEHAITMLNSHMTQQRQRAQMRSTDQKCQGGEKITDDYQITICSEEAPCELTEAEQENEENLKAAIATAREELTKLDTELEYAKDCIQFIEDGLEHLSLKLTVREDEASPGFVEKYIHIRDPKGVEPEIYEPNEWNPTHKYLLSGVATTNEITYVCTRRAPNLIETSDQVEPREQWWRLVYAANEKNPISVETSDAESVLIAAGSESKYPIMVYASETALEAEPIQLSEALRTFVRADNKVFQKELSSEQTQTGAQQPEPDAPLRLTAQTIEAIPEAEERWGAKGKRKLSVGSSNATIDSGDSRDVNMAFSGAIPPERLNEHYGELGSPAAQQPARMGGLVESLEKCQTSESNRDQEMEGVNDDMGKSPEMQERVGSHSPFMMRRPVEKASQAASSSTDAVDMDKMEVEVEHHEG